jgi:hypothetical protein
MSACRPCTLRLRADAVSEVCRPNICTVSVVQLRDDDPAHEPWLTKLRDHMGKLRIQLLQRCQIPNLARLSQIHGVLSRREVRCRSLSRLFETATGPPNFLTPLLTCNGGTLRVIHQLYQPFVQLMQPQRLSETCDFPVGVLLLCE